LYDNYFDGALDEIAVYSYALGTPTIQAHYALARNGDEMGADREVVFVHGINQDSRLLQSARQGTAPADNSFKDFLDLVPGGNVVIFSYYQDKGYTNQLTAQCATPAPDQSVGPLYVAPGGADSSAAVCDSKSAIAYNSTKLADELADPALTGTGPATVFAYSMGGAVARGWLTLSQARPSDPGLAKVDTMITFQGAQQGSYAGNMKKFLLDLRASKPGVANFLTDVAADVGFDPDRPAVRDLAPQSDWYQSVQAIPSVPPRLHYFNFFSDVQVTAHTQVLFVNLGDAPPPVSLGDYVMLPGDPNPNILPPNGGARFLPGGATADRHEYAAGALYDVPLSQDNVRDAVVLGLMLRNDPNWHLALPNNLNSGRAMVQSCQAGGAPVTPLTEMRRMLTDPARVCGA